MAAELAINTGASALQMAEAIFGNGVQISSASYSGAADASGIYSGGLTTSPGVMPSDSGVILSTGRTTDFTTAGTDPNIAPNTTTDFSQDKTIANGDAALTQMSGAQTYDAALLTVNFVPDGNMLTMQVVFSSEEYLEWVGLGYNDIVVIWVNGVPATMTVGTGDISIDNINTGSNSNLYVDNPADAPASTAYNTEMDGFTVTMTLKASVDPGTTNTITFAIADSGDGELDSNLLIAADSVQVTLIAADDSIELGKNDTATLDLLANDVSSMGDLLTVTEINGVAVTPGSTVVLASGETITLQPDGTISVTAAGTVQNSVFTYTVKDEHGSTDVGFAYVNSVACFTTGTLITLADGEKVIDALEVGDLVLTRDHGPQPLRWIGRTMRRAIGPDAPVALPANALGRHRPILLSQNHRILVATPEVELHFALPEALVPAKHLVGAKGVALREDHAPVLYYHLLFDRHEVIYGNGLPSESYLPGTTRNRDAEVEAELSRLFPGLPRVNGPRQTLARPVLKRHEGLILARSGGLAGNAVPAAA